MKNTALLVAVLALLSSVHLSLAVWPQPVSMTDGTTSLPINPAVFTVKTTSNSVLLQKAITRYHNTIFFPFPGKAQPSTLNLVQVTTKDDSDVLVLGVDESYKIDITAQGVATISANGVFGAMRGLETFSQLIVLDTTQGTYSVPNAPISIQDSPRFLWRGMLVDTARHYLDVDLLKETIDALSYNKMNTLHWHATDAESFPIVSESYPLLSRGAWAPEQVYTHQNIKDIVQYGLERGVRVVPEFDMPGHTASWGAGYPSIVAKCPKWSANINNIAFNPAQDLTYSVVSGFIKEMSALFTDSYLHLGGDEVVFGCWLNDPSIVSWMHQMGFTTGPQVEQYFEDRIRSQVLNQLSPAKNLMVWQEIFTSGIKVPKNTTIQVWISRDLLKTVLQAGYPAVLSAGWYLNMQIPNPSQTFYEWVDTWKNFYANEPTQDLSLTREEADLLLGGEVAMWGEQVDSVNFHSRVWPRSCGVSERLWSLKSVNDPVAALPRLIKFRCHLAQRGIGAGPVAPDYCPLPK